jgi:ubiquinone/menaquinone biosynthesis C-methylase UbiE
MQSSSGIQLHDVQAVYGGPEFELWELLMGQQIHIGGLQSSELLAEKADIRKATLGIDLCCCTGAGMSFLVHFRDVHRMVGVDATEAVVQLGRQRCQSQGLAERIEFLIADACQTGLRDNLADFVWGEDAWCYVVDKKSLIGEAARLVKPGGVIAFTDWVEGREGLSEAESLRFLRFMKFPNIQHLAGYAELLRENGCEVLVCEETEQFASHVDLYLTMLRTQLGYDALRIVGFDMNLFQAIEKEMVFMLGIAREGKIAQGRFVAKKVAE